MSIVYKAFDPRIDRYLAVKVLRQKFASELNYRQRFLREARAAGGLSHPNIVTVFDVGQADGVPYIAMEMLEGETLEARLERGERPSVEAIVDLAIQITRALTYAHRRGVIHRDIKPSNIHFGRESGVLKLMDFGIADLVRGPGEARRQEVAGTPAYMAPEQILGQGTDARSDLYSLGVVLYRLLSGHEPFRAERLSDLMTRVVHEPPDSLNPLDPETPVELMELVERLMLKKPGSRYERGEDVLEELQDIRLGLARGRQSGGFWKNWRWPMAVTAMVAVVLGAGLVLIYQHQSRAIAEVTYGYGEAMASIVGQELAEPLILDDSTGLSTLIGDFAENPRVRYLHLIDREGEVRSSTEAFLEGEPRPDSGGREIEWGSSSLRLFQVSDEVLEFQVPVRFQARRVGEVVLGLDSADLDAVAGLTLRMMALLFLVTVLAAMLGLVLLMRRLNDTSDRLGWAMGKVARGHYDFRLEERRRNELGSLFQRFNDMATRLEERHPGPEELAETPEPAISDERLEAGGEAEETLVLDQESERRRDS